MISLTIVIALNRCKGLKSRKVSKHRVFISISKKEKILHQYMLYFSATSKRMHFLHQSLTNIEFTSKIGNDFPIVQRDTIRIWKHVEKYQINVK